jgi:hypothetical protein
MSNIRLIKHEAIPDCGSFEVRFDDGRPSQFFYFEGSPGRRLRSDQFGRDVALKLAKDYARAMREELG